MSELQAEALRRSLAARMQLRTYDELRVIDRVLVGLEHGAEQYGPLLVATDPRLWNAEAEQEARDLLVYLACDFIARQNRLVEAIEREACPVERGLDELLVRTRDNSERDE